LRYLHTKEDLELERNTSQATEGIQSIRTVCWRFRFRIEFELCHFELKKYTRGKDCGYGIEACNSEYLT